MKRLLFKEQLMDQRSVVGVCIVKIAFLVVCKVQQYKLEA